MNNLVIQYNGKLVAGFSTKQNRVYFTCLVREAKKFNNDTLPKFLANYLNKDLKPKGIKIHMIQRGKRFDPLNRGDSL